MGYADLDWVKRKLDRADVDADEMIALDADLALLDDSMSAIFDEKCGRSWLVPTEAVPAPVPTPDVRAVSVTLGNVGGLFGSYAVALPPPGIIELVSVTAGATWDGTTWIGGSVVDPEAVAPTWLTEDGRYLGLYLVANVFPWQLGVWYGPWTSTFLVEAIWGDQASAVPVDVIQAVSFVVLNEYRQDNASPANMTGPDGMTIPLRNPWKFERVQAVISKYRVAETITV